MARIIRRGGPSAPARTFILQDLERRTGLKRRTLQTWGDAQVIIPETLHGGRGTVRRFPVSELVIALLLTPLAEVGIEIGSLVQVGDMIRQALGVRQRPAMVEKGEVPALPWTGLSELGQALERAATGTGLNLLGLTGTDETLFTAVVTDEHGEPPPFDYGFFRPVGLTRWPKFSIWIDLNVIAGVFGDSEVPASPKPSG